MKLNIVTEEFSGSCDDNVNVEMNYKFIQIAKQTPGV